MSGMNKAERLSEMQWRYIQRAYSDIEMAELLGTRRETIFRDRKELETEYPFIQDEKGRWKIDRSRFISEIKVNLHEALTLYLAGRKTARQTRFHQPHTASAVEKLAATLRQPMTGKLLKAADAVLKQEKDPERIKIIETLTQAWVEQYKVRIRYQGLKSAGITNHVISPYSRDLDGVPAEPGHSLHWECGGNLDQFLTIEQLVQKVSPSGEVGGVKVNARHPLWIALDQLGFRLWLVPPVRQGVPGDSVDVGTIVRIVWAKETKLPPQVNITNP